MVFFQSQICDGEPGSQRFGHIADVPGLVREAGDLLSVFGGTTANTPPGQRGSPENSGREKQKNA